MNKLFFAGLLFSFSMNLYAQKLGNRDLNQLKSFMQGNFSSEQQSATDTSFSAVSLHMKQVWPRRKDGYWLYVEQAMIQTPDKPYRQRMYHLYLQDDSTLVSQVFEFKDPAPLVGWWKEPKRFDSLKFFALSSRPGCEVYIRKNKKGQFIGSTQGNDCSSVLRGANYATSEVIIDNAGIRSWDRGWNADQQQVWGAVKGPYIFKKLPK
jgi:hypothetical protein